MARNGRKTDEKRTQYGFRIGVCEAWVKNGPYQPNALTLLKMRLDSQSADTKLTALRMFKLDEGGGARFNHSE